MFTAWVRHTVKGMKKLMLAAAGLTGILASCGSTGGPVLTTSVTITDATYTSDFYYEEVQNGTTVPRYVICNDRTNNLYLNVKWSGYLTQFGARFTKELNDGTTTSTEVNSAVSAPVLNGSRTFTYTMGTGATPLNVSVGGPSLSAQKVNAQAIVVTPTTIGNVFATVWGYNEAGLKGPELPLPGGIPVLASCG